MATIKFNFFKLPLTILGGLVGIILGYILGGIFVDIGILANINWESILIFFGAIFGAYLGYTAEL